MLAFVALVISLTALPPRTDQMIYDTANVIDDAEERHLEQVVHELWQKAGVAIVVLTVPSLTDETIDELAVRAGQTWGVGKQGQDRGLVVAFSQSDRKIYVATGYGTEGYLPDARVGRMLDQHAIPHLRDNRFSQGLVALTEALAAESARNFDVTLTGVTEQPPAPSSGGGGFSFIYIVIGIVLLMFVARRNPLLAMLLPGQIFGGGFRGGFDRGAGGFGGGFGGGGFGGGGFGGGGAGRSF